MQGTHSMTFASLLDAQERQYANITLEENQTYLLRMVLVSTVPRDGLIDTDTHNQQGLAMILPPLLSRSSLKRPARSNPAVPHSVPQTPCRPFARSTLTVALLALSACASNPALSPTARMAATLPLTPKPSVSLASTSPTGLEATRIKRPVIITGVRNANAHGPVSDADAARLLALRIALERALVDSGRYELVTRSDTHRRGATIGRSPPPSPDTLQLSAELFERAELSTVRLRIHASTSTATLMEFVGEGAPLRRTARLFETDRMAAGGARAGLGALDHAVRQALQSASAVLGTLPWQAPVLEIEGDKTILIAHGRRLGLKPGILLSIQTREHTLPRGPAQPPVSLAGRVVGEVLIVDNTDGHEHANVAVGALVSGSLRGYEMGDLVVRLCRPKGYFGYDFGHDHQCAAKAATVVGFDAETAVLSFEPRLLDEGEVITTPYSLPEEGPSAVF